MSRCFVVWPREVRAMAPLKRVPRAQRLQKVHDRRLPHHLICTLIASMGISMQKEPSKNVGGWIWLCGWLRTSFIFIFGYQRRHKSPHNNTVTSQVVQSEQKQQLQNLGSIVNKERDEVGSMLRDLKYNLFNSSCPKHWGRNPGKSSILHPPSPVF